MPTFGQRQTGADLKQFTTLRGTNAERVGEFNRLIQTEG